MGAIGCNIGIVLGVFGRFPCQCCMKYAFRSMYMQYWHLPLHPSAAFRRPSVAFRHPARLPPAPPWYSPPRPRLLSARAPRCILPLEAGFLLLPVGICPPPQKQRRKGDFPFLLCRIPPYAGLAGGELGFLLLPVGQLSAVVFLYLVPLVEVFVGLALGVLV